MKTLLMLTLHQFQTKNVRINRCSIILEHNLKNKDFLLNNKTIILPVMIIVQTPQTKGAETEKLTE